MLTACAMSHHGEESTFSAFADPNIFRDEFLFLPLLSGQTMLSKNVIFKDGDAAAACRAQLKWEVFVAAVTRF